MPAGRDLVGRQSELAQLKRMLTADQLAFGLKEFQSRLDERDRAVLAPVFGGYPDSEVAVLPLASGLLSLLGWRGRTSRCCLWWMTRTGWTRSVHRCWELWVDG